MPLARLVLAPTLVAPAAAEAQFGADRGRAPRPRRLSRSRLATALTLVLAAPLALTAQVGAQVAEAEPAPAIVPPRFEVGAVAGLTVAFPEVGALASIPVGSRASFELGVGWMPRIVYDVDHASVLVQFRLPFRADLRSRRSLLLGATRLAALDRNGYDSGFWGDADTVVFPHAGVSLQWPMGRSSDFRFDAVGLFTLDGEFPLVPRAVATFVWHP